MMDSVVLDLASRVIVNFVHNLEATAIILKIVAVVSRVRITVAKDVSARVITARIPPNVAVMTRARTITASRVNLLENIAPTPLNAAREFAPTARASRASLQEVSVTIPRNVAREPAAKIITFRVRRTGKLLLRSAGLL